MSKTYERSSTGIYGGERTGWGDAKWGSYRPTGGTGTTNRWQGQSSNPPDKYYYVTNILFNSSELAALRDKASIITSVKLKITVTSGDIPPSGTQSYPIGYKYNSATGVGSGNVTSDAWARGNYDSTEMSSDTIGYVTSSGGQISASNTELEILLGTGVPKYGYVLGPNYSAANGVLRIASSAKLYVTTNESDYSYTLAYNANGGSGAPGSETKTNTQVSPSCTFTISNTKPTKTGYTFSKWNTKANGTGTNYNPGDSITVTSAGTTTLYAIWTINTWQVKYDANGGTGAPAAQTKTYGVDLTLSSTIPTRANASSGSYTVTYNANSGSVSPASASAARTTSYSFKNWNTASGGGGTSYASGGSYKANEAATMYAQWNVSTSTASVTLPTPTRTGYNFNGWYTAASGGTKIGNAGASYTPTASITIYAQWTAAVGSPTFTTQPSSKSVYRGASTSLSVAATTSQGTITYQWQSSSNNSTWTNISGATATSYTTPTTTVGTVYYRCVATATKDGVSKSTNSNSASVAVSATPTPSITTQPSNKSVSIGGTASLSVAASVASGALSYQWYSSANGSTWSAVSGATSSSYSAPTSSSGTTYYKARVTNTLNGYTAYTDSNSVNVTVSVDAPTINTQPTGGTVFVGSTKTLTVSATAPYGTLSYQWQSSTTNTSGSFSNITGATSTSYTVPTSTVGTVYYRCVVTATYSGKTPSTASKSVSVAVVNVTTPTFTTNPQSANYAYGVTANALTATATSNGTVSYQWQTSPDNSTWTNISGATSTSYTPATMPAGVTYYRCVATATGGTQTKTANSSSASITVVQASAPVFTYDLSSVDVTYNAGDVATVLNGTATVVNGTLSYQWYKSTDNGNTWFPIPGEQSATYQPSTNLGGTAYYRVVATNIVGTSSVSSTSGAAKVTIQNVILSYDAKWAQYINSVGKPFVKLARLDFLNPNGSVLFTLDNNPNNAKSGAFIQSGELSVNLQNGARRIATVTLSNLDGEFDYNVNKLWFGQQVRLWEGMILPSGQDFYVSQGVFYVKDPDEVFEPGLKQTTLTLVDKWAYLDGTLFGNIEGTYEVPLNSNVFNVIQSVLNLDRGNGQKIDSSVPIFTSYYNGKTTTLPDGSSVPLTNTPYTYRCDSENGTYADIVLEMNTMLAGWIGYDANGQLRLDPSQDDIIDTTKPVQWQFSTTNSTFLGATYSVKNSEVYNDIIIVGESLSEYGQTAGRATNYDPKSDTNANIIGLKTKRYQQAGYYTQDICESLAVFKLKRESVLKKSVSIKCSQLFHIQENNLVTIERTDKPGNPIERHLVVGYTRPIAQNGEMILNATSVMDQPVATITTAP